LKKNNQPQENNHHEQHRRIGACSLGCGVLADPHHCLHTKRVVGLFDRGGVVLPDRLDPWYGRLVWSLVMQKDVYPAFPVPREISWAENADGSRTPLVGMSLRDYIAIEAMKVLIANDETTHEEDAADAYAIADKMLKARDA
jgi:hypothetical protein